MSIGDLMSLDPGTTVLIAAVSFLVFLVGFALARHRFAGELAALRLQVSLLDDAAHTDALTGLGNRRAFDEDLKREVSRATRYGSPLSLALLDVDEFKAVNDASGHAAGDRTLAGLATVLFMVRAEDRSYRIGGDEFAILMPNTPLDGALATARRLKAILQEGLAGISLSVGLATVEAPGEPGVLREKADLALYKAKGKGRGEIVVFEDEKGLAEETLTKWHEVRALLSAKSIPIALQPIYELSTKRLFAHEALMRFPQGGLVTTPTEAFEIADRMGVVAELDAVCIERAIASASQALPRGDYLFLNIDPRTITHPSFNALDLVRQVQRSGLDPARVVIEITERSPVPVEELRVAAFKLQSLKFKLAMDDGGSGNSGLEVLRSVHFDFIKIDRSVVLDAVDGGPGKAVMMAILAYASESGAAVIAEGIESAAMLDVVNMVQNGPPNLSIKGVQGFLFGRPQTVLPDEVGAPATDEAA